MILNWTPETDMSRSIMYEARECLVLDMGDAWRLSLADMGIRPKCRNHDYVFHLLQRKRATTPDTELPYEDIVCTHEFKAKDYDAAEEKAVKFVKYYAKSKLTDVNRFKRAIRRGIDKRDPFWYKKSIPDAAALNTWVMEFSRDIILKLQEHKSSIPTRRRFHWGLITNATSPLKMSIYADPTPIEVPKNAGEDLAQTQAIQALGNQVTNLWRHHRALYVASCELLSGLYEIATPAGYANINETESGNNVGTP